MKKTRLVPVVAAAALAGFCFAQETPAPSTDQAPAAPVAEEPAAPQHPKPLTAEEAQALLSKLKTQNVSSVLLCWPMFQYPYYQFVVRPGANAQDALDKWNESFDLLARHALANPAFAEALLAEGNALFVALGDDAAGSDLMQRFQMFCERLVAQSCESLYAEKPDQVVPFVRELIGKQTAVVCWEKGVKTLPPGPITTLKPESIGSFIRWLHGMATGEKGDAKIAAALDAEILSFLSGELPADVRDSLIDTLLAPSFERAQTNAAAVHQLIADAGRLRAKLTAEDAQTVINQRLQAFGERMINQTSLKLCGEDPAKAIGYLQRIASTRVFCARFGEKEMAEFSKADFPPPSDEFILRLIAETYPRIAESAVSTENMRALNDLVVKTLVGEAPEKVPSNLLNAFLDGSVKRAQDDAESAHMLFADADKLIAGLADTNSQVAVERRCRQFARKSVIKTFRDICPGRPNDVIPYLKKLADTGTLRALYGNNFVDFKPGRTTAVSPDLVGQLAEEAIIGFSNDSNTKMLSNILNFTATLLPKLSDDAKQTMLDRRLDAFFLVGNYDGAIDLLEKGLPSHSPGWCRGTAAKLRYHKALNEGKKEEAIKQLMVFIEFMQSDEQKEFEDCDPTTGIIYSREWVIAKNFMRCAEIARDLKDAANEAKYLAEAKKLYATALEKAKDDSKALAELKKEMQAAGL